MSELEQKRLAVLASLRKNRSQSQSPHVVEVSRKNCSEKELLDAVLDLRRLGYSFDRIIEESGVSRKFLERCYDKWAFPVLKPVPLVVHAPVPVPVVKNNVLDNRYKNPVLTINSRPKFNNKYVRETENRPEWLDNLYFTLETTDEESGGEEEVVEIPLKRSSHLQKESNKKRKMSDSLEDITLKKKQINLKVDLLSKKIKNFEKMDIVNNELTEKDKNILILTNQISQIEKSLDKLKKKLSNDLEIKNQLTSKIDEYKSLKDSLANGLIELDNLEQLESKLKERRKSESRKSNDEPRNPNLVSDETIHKIPKVITLLEGRV